MQHTGIVIGITQWIGLLVAGCLGVIFGSWAMYLTMRKRDDRIWEAIQHPGQRRDIPAEPVTEIISAVVTDAPVRKEYPAEVFSGDENPRYTPTPGLYALDDTLTGMGFPGTQTKKAYAAQAAAQAADRETTQPSDTVAAVPPRSDATAEIDIWGEGKSVDDILTSIGFPSKDQCLALATGQDW